MRQEIVAKVEALRKALEKESERNWEWILYQGRATKWCALGLLVAKLELGITWREVGACFDMTSGQASHTVRKLQDDMTYDRSLFDSFTAIVDRIAETKESS